MWAVTTITRLPRRYSNEETSLITCRTTTKYSYYQHSKRIENRPLRAKYIHSYNISPKWEKNFEIFPVRHFEGIYTISSILWYCCSVVCKNEQGKSGKGFYRFPTEEEKKMHGKRPRSGNTAPNVVFPYLQWALFSSLVAMLARINEVRLWTVLMFKLVLSSCVELSPWPLTGSHSNNPRNSMKQPLYAPSVFAFVKESGKKQDGS